MNSIHQPSKPLPRYTPPSIVSITIYHREGRRSYQLICGGGGLPNNKNNAERGTRGIKSARIIQTNLTRCKLEPKKHKQLQHLHVLIVDNMLSLMMPHVARISRWLHNIRQPAELPYRALCCASSWDCPRLTLLVGQSQPGRPASRLPRSQ